MIKQKVIIPSQLQKTSMKKEIESAGSIADIFGIVKRVVRESLGREQAGLLVALSDLGAYPGYLVGAYYNLAANTIVINKRALHTVPQERQNMYLFQIILHEYIHSLGFYDEQQVRQVVEAITRERIGPDVQSEIGAYMNQVHFGEPSSLDMEYISGIDREGTNYIM